MKLITLNASHLHQSVAIVNIQNLDKCIVFDDQHRYVLYLVIIARGRVVGKKFSLYINNTSADLGLSSLAHQQMTFTAAIFLFPTHYIINNVQFMTSFVEGYYG